MSEPDAKRQIFRKPMKRPITDASWLPTNDAKSEIWEMHLTEDKYKMIELLIQKQRRGSEQ